MRSTGSSSTGAPDATSSTSPPARPSPARAPLAADPKLVPMFPSGHLAGIGARSDAARGVHKAPANEVIRGAIDLTYQLTPAEQGDLNDNGVNCIRFFEREGIRVWGA